MIRQGAKAKVQFAGHYTIPQWGCGTNCVQFVIVDSVSGRVYDAPFWLEGLALTWLEKQSPTPTELDERLDFRPDSHLLKMNGCPKESDCGFYDYEMVDGVGLKLLRKEVPVTLNERSQP